MAQNYISRGEVITLTAGTSYTSGLPYRISGFNGVALLTVESGDLLSFQLEGIFEFTLASVTAGDLVYIDASDDLTLTSENNDLYGRAVTSSDSNDKFYCRILQS
jgi:predicted RecA/RadA family phage recombinase